MSKQDKVAIITLCIVIMVLLAVYIIIAFDFFTKDNIMKSTTENETIACMQEKQKKVSNINEVKQKLITSSNIGNILEEMTSKILKESEESEETQKNTNNSKEEKQNQNQNQNQSQSQKQNQNQNQNQNETKPKTTATTKPAVTKAILKTNSNTEEPIKAKKLTNTNSEQKQQETKQQEQTENKKENTNSNISTKQQNTQIKTKTTTETKKQTEIKSQPQSQSQTQTQTKKDTTTFVPSSYQGLPAVGRIEIPKNGINIPILSNVSVKGMEIASCLLYSTGNLNQKGNNLIVAHNYKNLFRDNKKLNVGDKIYVTSLDGKRVEYTVYDKFTTTPERFDYVARKTSSPEITLSTCTNNDDYRLVILAKANN